MNAGACRGQRCQISTKLELQDVVSHRGEIQVLGTELILLQKQYMLLTDKLYL